MANWANEILKLEMITGTSNIIKGALFIAQLIC